jgi:hypothetical protein
MVFSAARPLTRQLPAHWLAGVLVAAVTGGGVAVGLALRGDVAGLMAWAAGALFIPSLATALGAWSGSSKLFEVAYVVLWYLGPLNRLAALDFLGATGQPAPAIWLLAALGLAALAVVGRARQLRT